MTKNLYSRPEMPQYRASEPNNLDEPINIIPQNQLCKGKIYQRHFDQAQRPIGHSEEIVAIKVGEKPEI